MTSAVALALLVATGSAVPASASTADRSVPAAAPAPVTSVVVFGDSVAAGEGARDGYTYRDRVLFPGWSRAGGGQGGGDACGRSDAAYGARVAEALDATLTNLACSGASFERGITLDGRFDAAEPELVLVTAGANSIAFERAYAFCVLSARGVASAEAARIVRSSSLGGALVTALELAARRAFGNPPTGSDPACTAADPGDYLRATVLDRADAVGEEARALAAAIRARGAAIGRVPEIVFTTYADPLPETTTGFARCPDGAGLGPTQLAFMHDLFATLNRTLRDALVGVPGVRVADPDPAFAGHRWCDRDPWVYGPSIFVADPTSRVPFHPTPAGQQAIAAAVLAARAAGGGEWRSPV